MWILIAKCYQNAKVKRSPAFITLAKSTAFRSNKPESCSKGDPHVRGHMRTAGLLQRSALVLVFTAWGRILLDAVNYLPWYVYCEPRTVLEIKWEETVNGYLQQQSQKDEVERPTLVNQQHHSNSTRRVS